MRRLLALATLPLCGLTLAACGSAASTAGFKGEQHEAAQAVSNLQSDATAGQEKKVCADDLAAAIVTRLGGQKGCEAAIKSQLTQIDNLETTVNSIVVTGTTASAHVNSVYAGKKKVQTVTLVKEGKSWKLSAIG